MPCEALLTDGFVAVDLETTGLDRRRDAIVSLAAVTFRGGEPESAFVTLVHPGRPIPPASTRIHGIDDALVADAPPESSAVRRLDEICAGRVVVGHGLAFDLSVLRRVRGDLRHGAPAAALCTTRLVEWLERRWIDRSLEAMAAELDFSIEGRHTAEGDAIAAGRLFTRLLPHVQSRGVRTLSELVWVHDSVISGR